MQKTITDLKAEKNKLLEELDAYIPNDLESEEAKEILKRLACIDDEIKSLNDNIKITAAVEEKRIKRRIKLKNLLDIAPAVLLALFIVLTVVLNTSDVFKGTYEASENDYQITFYDNTFDFEDGDGYIVQGFFNSSGNEINLSADDWSYRLERVSVYKLKDSRGLTFECGGAIILQTFYSVCTVACAIILAVQVRRLLKAKKQND